MLNNLFCSCNGTLTDRDCHNCLVYGLNLISELVFLQTNWLDFFLQVLNLNFLLVSEHAVKNHWFFGFPPRSGFLLGQNCQKMLKILTCQGIQNHISSAPLASFFHQGISTLSVQEDNLFLKIMENILYGEIGVLIDQKWQKCFSYWVILIVQLFLLKNYQFEVFYQGLK